MGCAQSSQTSSDKRRSSREFYHQYGVHTPPSTAPRHAFVNSKPPVKQVGLTASRPTSAAATPRPHQPPRHQPPPPPPPVVPPSQTTFTAGNGGEARGNRGTTPNRPTSPEDGDMPFRRQDFDRNSVLRRSRKRSRKTSSASLNTSRGANNTSAAAGVGRTSPKVADARTPTNNASPVRKVVEQPALAPRKDPIIPTQMTRKTSEQQHIHHSYTSMPPRKISEPPPSLRPIVKTPEAAVVASDLTPPPLKNEANMSASENVAALLSRNTSSSTTISVPHQPSSYKAVAVAAAAATELNHTKSSDTSQSSISYHNGSRAEDEEIPHIDEDGARLI